MGNSLASDLRRDQRISSIENLKQVGFLSFAIDDDCSIQPTREAAQLYFSDGLRFALERRSSFLFFRFEALGNIPPPWVFSPEYSVKDSMFLYASELSQHGKAAVAWQCFGEIYSFSRVPLTYLPTSWLEKSSRASVVAKSFLSRVISWRLTCRGKFLFSLSFARLLLIGLTALAFCWVDDAGRGWSPMNYSVERWKTRSQSVRAIDRPSLVRKTQLQCWGKWLPSNPASTS